MLKTLTDAFAKAASYPNKETSKENTYAAAGLLAGGVVGTILLGGNPIGSIGGAFVGNRVGAYLANKPA